MAQTQQSRPELTVPSSLDATSSKLVYLCLAEGGESTVSELAETLDMRMLALYSVLGSLVDQDLVERRGETYHLRE